MLEKENILPQNLNNSDQRQLENLKTSQKNISFLVLTVQHKQLLSTMILLKHTGLAKEPQAGLTRWYTGKSEETSRCIHESSLGDWKNKG